jgi:hypothetical protein
MSVLIENFTTILPYLDGREFDENMTVPYQAKGKIEFRNDVLVEMCRNKRVLHIGCCDHVPLIKEKIRKREWLHGLITECASHVAGVDIDAAAVRAASQISGLENLYAGDVTADGKIAEIANMKFDIALFGEVVEHVANPAFFLGKFRENYADAFSEVIITVPNALRGGNVRGIFKNVETINSDHRFFFTPYTIAKIAMDAGFAPKEVRMAAFTKAGMIKTMLLNRMPLLAEDIIFTGANPGVA